MKKPVYWISKREGELYERLLHKTFKRQSGMSKECSLDVEEAALVHKVMEKAKGQYQKISMLKIKVLP